LWDDSDVANVDHYLALWESEMLARRLSARTINERLRFIRHIQSLLGCPLSLGEDDIRSFLATLAKTKAPTTQFNYHTILRMWFAWLCARGFRDDDPTLVFGKPRLPRMAPRPAETDHVRTLLSHGNLQTKTHMKVLLAALQGMRTIEIARVRGEDVDFVAMKLRILGKGNIDTTVDLHPDVAAFAREHPDKFPLRDWWFPSPTKPGFHVLPASVSKVLADAFRRVNLPVTAHQLRHWTATELIRRDVPTRVVQRVMRHSSIQTTEGYTAVADDRSAEALRRLPHLAP